jgi:23S rRNA pseudouridine1911/1915/1917 synthase
MNEYYEPIVYRVKPEDHGKALRVILRKRMGLSRRLVSRLKKTDQGILVNGRSAWTSDEVSAGDIVEVRMPAETSEHILPQPMPVSILHEDSDLLVVDKPPGLVVHPTRGHYVNTLANAVAHYWREQGKSHRFRPVHRLDQDTSGVLCVAKNPFAHWHIAGQMQRNEVDKMYLALVAGIVNEERGTVHAPIGRDPDAPHMRIVTPDGDPSVTHYETVARFEKAGATLLRLRLETGRTHQIRVHMKHIGHPLLGDGMYGPDERSLEQSLGIDRQALHAEQLGFAHPRSGERVRYIAPLPGDMRRWIERLKDFEPHDAAADSNK